MTRSKQESTPTIRLVNLATKRDSVFTAFSSRLGSVPSPFWRENARLAHTLWLRLRRVRTIKDIMRARALKPIADDGLRPIADGGLKPIADDGLKPIADDGLKPIADDGTRTVLRTQERTGLRPQGGARAPQRAASASELPWRAFTHAHEQDFVLKDEPPCPDRLASIEDALMDFVEDE